MQKKEETKQFIRAPIVTFMGHVDHGKTSLLDAIRHTSVQAKEYGGITQHIGACSIEYNDNPITFVDTPGHSAFTQMRARGGKVADIVVLVVAADQGVQPQTKEAISHARAAKASIIVAINKVDLPGADAEKVKQQLAQENILVEAWGGDIVAVEVSATTRQNLEGLLDAILVTAELLELKANPSDELEAVIIESKKDPKQGVLVNSVLRNGTLSLGDEITASGLSAKVKRIMDEKGNGITEATPTMPVSIMGFNEAPNVGDLILQKGSELAELALDADKVEIVGTNSKNMISIIIKTDTKGTLEAVKESLADMVTSSVGNTYSLKFVHTATGPVTDSDILLAQSVDGVVLGFNVAVANSAKQLSQSLKIPVKTYKTIYDLIDEAQDLLAWTAEKDEEKIKGRAEILKLFKLPSGDIVAGSKVLAGRFMENSPIAVYDKNPADLTLEDVPLFRSRIKKLKIGNNDEKSVSKGKECGIMLKPQIEELSPGMYLEVIG
ncbi:MAG TPA: translation initiation factor IF-2 [candidate division WWE3 bacterium]|uniref:Translation initiation factor IF-2 n=1 Tax=candidate division WWE3 bacterium TaxID=2053526 RepID=A0A7C1DIR1_UNCKA|nr:translation initiation factor IF-2 [candidate division WWE3 bacterium]